MLPLHTPLISYINGFASTPLTPSEVEVVKNTFVHRKVRKRQYFLQKAKYANLRFRRERCHAAIQRG